MINEMIDNLMIRSANLNDIDFIIETIIEADKSSTNIISVCNIFSLREDEYRELLKNILSEDIPNCEYSLTGFLVAEREGKILGALNSWVEGLDGIPNSMTKSNLILSFIDKEKLLKNKEIMYLINALTLEREKNAIQLEYGYVVNDKRRKKIFTNLIIESIRKHFNSAHKAKVQTMLYKENYPSYLAFEKLGFKVTQEKKSDAPEIFSIFPYNSKVLMELNKDEAEKLILQNSF
ncbi:MAG: hypothetical protein STSR0008_21040 [Ignavibacterium sp.]